MPEASPYATAALLGRAAPTHIKNETDKARVLAYWTYTDIFNNAPDVWAKVMRSTSGDELSVRYIPSARTIIEATNRYLGKDLEWVVGMNVDEEGAPDDAVVQEVMNFLNALFAREAFGSKFYSLKRFTLNRGDGIIHITYDMNKEQGKRLSITELDPGTYFPIQDPQNAERVLGCYIVNLIDDEEGDGEIAQRLEYRRILTPDDAAKYAAPVGSVYTRLTYWEMDGWDDRYDPEEAGEQLQPPASISGSEAMAPILEGTTLPPAVSSIPIYHFRNNPRGGELFGTSEIQGLETVLAGISQVATDEDLAVALMGIGVYWTDSGRPVDGEGNALDWEIWPASMLELEDGKRVGRLEGAGSVQPLLDHMEMLEAKARETSATPEVAVGRVRDSAQASGIALAIELLPILSKNAEKEEEINNKLDQMLYDLCNMWLPAVEGVRSEGVVVTSAFGPAAPIDRAAVLKEILDMITAGIVSAEWARQEISKRLGYSFPTDMLTQMAAESSAMLDSVAPRLDAAESGL